MKPRPRQPKVIVEIKFRDDRTENFICTDTPYVGGDWVTLYFGHERKSYAAQGIAHVFYHFA